MKHPHLKSRETPEAGIKRLGTGILNDAEVRLQTWGEPNEVVHELRKDFKKFRALLRLVRDPLGEGPYRTANRIIRDAGRHLSGLRDSYVLIQTLELLRKRHERLASDRAFGSIQGRLKVRHAALLEKTIEALVGGGTLLQYVREAQHEVGRWEIPQQGFEAFSTGIRRVYERGRNARQASLKVPEAGSLHLWRKRVKYLHYQMGYLMLVWPRLMSALETELGLLGVFLGEEHDLAVLQQTLEAGPELYEDSPEPELLNSLIAQSRNELQIQTWPLGERIYWEAPDLFVERLGAYWQAQAF